MDMGLMAQELAVAVRVQQRKLPVYERQLEQQDFEEQYALAADATAKMRLCRQWIDAYYGLQEEGE